MRKTASIILCAVAVLAPRAHAQEIETITVKKSDAVAVSVSGITGPEVGPTTQVVVNDLSLAGGLSVNTAGGGNYSVKGNAAAGSLSGTLADASGKVVLNKNYSGAIRTNAHAFANDIVQAILGQKGNGNSKIAFISSRSGRKEVYTADYDGANVVQLTKDNGISVGPALGPDARKLAYTGYMSGYADVYVIDLASGSRNRIIKFPGTNTGAAFSPDGGRLAVSSSKDGNPELYVTGAGGGGAKRLTRTRGVESSPTWSPDGGEIIYVSDDSGSPQLYRVSSGGGAPRKIDTGFGYCTEPSWSPDGKKLAFNVRAGGSLQIAVLDFASGNVRVITSGGDAEDPVFGPNSRSIIFVQGGSLHMIDAQSGKRSLILGNVGKISEPTWSRE